MWLECRCLQKCFLIWNYCVGWLMVLTQSKATFFWSNLVFFFYNKSKILTILFIVKYEKNHTFWWVFSVFGAHNQQVFLHFQMRKKTKQKQQRVRALVLSLWLKGLPMTNNLAILSKCLWQRKSFIALTLRLLDFSFSAEIVRHKGAERQVKKR